MTPPESKERDEQAEAAEKEAGQSEEEKTESGQAAEQEGEEGEMSLMQHLGEFRVRLVRCAISIGVGFLACYGFSKELFRILMKPLIQALPEGNTLQATALPETFFTYLKVSLVAGFFLTSPYIFYQIWQFIAPGLYKEEKKYLAPIAFCSGLFFTAGALFGYFGVFPIAFEFFADFSDETIRLTPKVSEYWSFSLKLLIAFGLIFELPLASFFLARMGIVTGQMMRKYRKYALIGAFIVSAILTPPDVVSQLLMAGPLIILFEVSIWVAQIFGRKPQPTEEDEEEKTESAA